MIFRVGIENGNEHRSIAWMVEHPGCFAYGQDQGQALQAAPAAIQEYTAWMASHTVEPWLEAEPIQIQVEDGWDVYGMNEEYEVRPLGEPGAYSINAWFRSDWKPLSEEDVRRGLQLLDWSREDLLKTIAGLGQAELDQHTSGERWSIAGILGHIGGAEWWYLDRLGLAFPRSDVPRDPFERMDVVRSLLKRTLPELVETVKVLGTNAELWSYRKLLRRAVWHERDHTAHIAKLLAQCGSPG
jgi:uncharacterized damage-inducible protein DinB